jgi:hypothetical protein
LVAILARNRSSYTTPQRKHADRLKGMADGVGKPRRNDFN